YRVRKKIRRKGVKSLISLTLTSLVSPPLFHGDKDGDFVFSVVLPPVKSTTEPTKASLSTSTSLCYSPPLSTSLRLSPPLRFSPPLCFSPPLSASFLLSPPRRFSPPLAASPLIATSPLLSASLPLCLNLRTDNFFSVISVTGNGDVFLDAQYRREGEMEDERVDLVLERIRNKYDWSSTDWPVLDPEESKMEEPDSHDRGSEADKSVDHTDVVADEETSSVQVAGKGKRKFLDEGAETRKKKVLCKRSAEKFLTFGPETKSFIEGLIRTSVTSLGDVLSMQMANMERVFTERMGKMEIEVSQLKGAISLTGEGSYPSKKETEEAPLNSKAKQAPPKSKGAQAPPKSKGAEAPPKRKGDQPTPTKKDGKKIATETNDFDFGLSTQDLRDLSQATFVDGFDLSQVKAETSSKSKPFNMAPLQWNDEEMDRTKEDSPDAALVFFREEDWEKVRTWSTSSTRIRIGPATLDFEIANRLMDKSEWLNSLEIDAAMYVFRERTSLKRWRPHRVAFMTVVFSNMIKKEYGHLEAQGRKSYMLHNLLLQFGKGVLPLHGRTHEIWNIDVDRLYVPVHVSGNHWIALCISFVTRSIEVFDCSGRKRYKEVDGFANLIPRIVK
ncbi:hypothetical protein IGI04_003624, partial [Brassica rapa subsp. trilocularis]